MGFGEKLKQARTHAGLTQEDVVRQIGVSRQSVSNWENNRSYPDLASVLKLSDLYGVSLDDLLRHDAALRREMEERQERVKKYSSWLHDFAMLLIASNILLTWMDKTALGIALGVVGVVLIFVVYFLFVRYLGADWKTMALRSVALATWSSGYMLRIASHHSSWIGELLWFGGLAVECYVSVRMKSEPREYKHMTAFTGFVIAAILVFGGVPMSMDAMERGDHVEANPFNSTDYRVAQVLAGDQENIPMVYLGSTNYVHLDYPGEESEPLDGQFTYITQPEGAETKGVWEMLSGEVRYRVTVDADDRATMTCLEKDQTLWAYLLEPSPKMGCTILDVLGTVVGSADWYYAGAFDKENDLSGLPLRGKGTIKLSVPGDSPTVTICEEYRDGDSVEFGEMTLTKDSRGFVEFKRATRQNDQKQTGIYRIPYEDGEFVLVLNFTP